MTNPQPMGYGQHLEELRRRIIIMLCAGAAPFAATFMLLRYQALDIALWPMLSRAPETIKLATLRPEELIFVAAKIALAVAIVVASPVAIYQAWAFISPGLKKN